MYVCKLYNNAHVSTKILSNHPRTSQISVKWQDQQGHTVSLKYKKITFEGKANKLKAPTTHS